MPQVSGRRVPQSLPRAWVDDLMAHSRGVPTVTFERRMDLADVAAARDELRSPPAWVLLFAKAYAVVAARRPELRQAYLPRPWPHLWQADESVASIAVEREYRGEPAVFFGFVKAPDRLPLVHLMRHLHHWKTSPVERVNAFRRLVRFTRVPRPLRRLLWQYALSWSGAAKARNFGTFGVSVTGGLGATARNLLSPLATALSTGVLTPGRKLDVRLHFDHRVLDGAPAARALADLEGVLRTDIRSELRQMQTARHVRGVKATDVIERREANGRREPAGSG